MKCNESDKLEARFDKSNFMGYPKQIKGYYFYHPIEQKVFVSKHAIFLENEILLERSSGSKIELSEVKELQNSINQLDGMEHISNVVGVEQKTQPTFKQQL